MEYYLNSAVNKLSGYEEFKRVSVRKETLHNKEKGHKQKHQRI